MELRYRISEEDYINFSIEQMENSKDISNFVLLQTGLTATTFLVFIIYIYRYTDRPIHQFLIFYLVVLLGWILFERLIIKLIIRNKIDRDIKNNGDIFGEKVLRLGDNYLYEISSKKTLEVEWSDIKFIEDGKNYLYIFVVSSLGYIIPKASIYNKEDLDEFLLMIKDKID